MAAPATAVARLEAGAKGGTAGVKAFDDAQQQVKASRNEAIHSLNRDAALVGAPGALTAGLDASLARPAATAMANLSQYGAAAANMNAVDAAGTQTYRDEARQAIGVIDAEARRSEAQREALLRASSSGSSGATRAPKQLSDSALRTDLLGAATQARAAQAADAAQQAQGYVQGDAFQADHAARLAALNPTPSMGGVVTGPASIWANRTPTVGPTPDEAVAQSRANDQPALQQALAQILNRQYGPGVTADALKLAQPYIDQGILDPNRVQGLLSPAVEQGYVSANTKLGNYTPPGLVQNAASDPIQTATALGYQPKQYRDAMRGTYIDWNSKAIQHAINGWLKSSPDGPKLEADGDVNAIRDAFVAAHPSGQLTVPIVETIIANAHKAIDAGIDYGTFVHNWTLGRDAIAAHENSDAVNLALAMVRQMFDYRQAQNRQGALTPTGAAPYAP